MRYRIKSWRRFDMCVEDARAAIAESGADRVLLLGFSMGGGIAVTVAGDARVERVLGLAPWLADAVSLEPLRGKRLDVLHGSLDRSLPGVPGVSPRLSRRGFDRARALGVEGSYELIPGALHAIALRARNGRPFALPRAGAWLRRVESQLASF